MLRLAPAAGRFLGSLLLGSHFLLAGCSGPPAPDPSKLSETKNLVQQPTPGKLTDSPFTNPDIEPPKPRSEPQLPPDELAAALARADAARKVGDLLETSIALRPCANKVPQDVRCEGELAAVLVKMPRHRFEAQYYLQQAIAGDDPALTSEYYRDLGDALSKRGMYVEAAVAYQRLIDRAQPATAADYNQLAVALQGVPSRVADAAAALRKAYELDDTRHDWLRDEAILLAQLPDRLPEAITRFEHLKQRATDREMIIDADRRIAEIEVELAARAAASASKALGKKPAKPTP